MTAVTARSQAEGAAYWQGRLDGAREATDIWAGLLRLQRRRVRRCIRIRVRPRALGSEWEVRLVVGGHERLIYEARSYEKAQEWAHELAAEIWDAMPAEIWDDMTPRPEGDQP